MTSIYVGFGAQLKLAQNAGRDNFDQKVYAIVLTYDANGNIQSVQGALTDSFRLGDTVHDHNNTQLSQTQPLRNTLNTAQEI